MRQPRACWDGAGGCCPNMPVCVNANKTAGAHRQIHWPKQAAFIHTASGQQRHLSVRWDNLSNVLSLNISNLFFIWKFYTVQQCQTCGKSQTHWTLTWLDPPQSCLLVTLQWHCMQHFLFHSYRTLLTVGYSASKLPCCSSSYIGWARTQCERHPQPAKPKDTTLCRLLLPVSLL